MSFVCVNELRNNLINVWLFINKGGFTSRFGPKKLFGFKNTPKWTLFSNSRLDLRAKTLASQPKSIPQIDYNWWESDVTLAPLQIFTP